MTDHPACRMCRYWQPNDGTELRGECRYNLPVVGLDLWPLTDSTDWCREFAHHSNDVAVDSILPPTYSSV